MPQWGVMLRTMLCLSMINTFRRSLATAAEDLRYTLRRSVSNLRADVAHAWEQAKEL